MHRRNPSKDSSNRGNRISQRGQRITRKPITQITTPKSPPPINYKDGPNVITHPSHNLINPAPPVISYGAGPNLQHLTHRIIKPPAHPVNVSVPGTPPPPYKHKREVTFQKKAEMPLRNVPIQVDTPINPHFGSYMGGNSQIGGKLQELNTYVTGFNGPQFNEARGLVYRPKEPAIPMVPPSQMVYDKMFPLKSNETLLKFPQSETINQFSNLKPEEDKSPKKQASRQNVSFKLRLERLNSVLDQVNRVCERVKFAVVNIFRVRLGYKLKEYEQYYLFNVERVYRYLLFLFVLNGYKESLSFSVSNAVKDEFSWETGKFLKFFNEETDLALVSKTILTTGSINTNPSTNIGTKGNARSSTKNRESTGNVSNETQIDNYKAIKWDSEPVMTYAFNIPPPTSGSKSKDDMLLLIRTINLNVIIGNMPTLKYLCYMYKNTNESVLNMLGYYSLICPDEDYIIIISSILPSLDDHQIRVFYSNLASLLDLSKCNLQLYYLERFIERFVPICFSQERSCWKRIINNIVMVINPLKLSNKKYMNCCISLVRTIKSFCDKFVECEKTTFNVFLMSLKFLLQSSDDSRILIRGESTDLLIQIWLNLKGKEIILKCMNYDLIKILGMLSGVQSIKLNIWTYLLSSVLPTGVTVTSNTSGSANSALPDTTNNTSTCGTESNDNVLNFLLKNSKRDGNTLINLVSYRECMYIFNLLLYLDKNNVDRSVIFKGIVGMSMEKHDVEQLENDMIIKKRIGLYWYVTKFLRVNKSLLQYEKLSLIVRLSYKLFKHYLYYMSVNHRDDDLRDNSNKKTNEEGEMIYDFEDDFDSEDEGDDQSEGVGVSGDSAGNNKGTLELYKLFVKKLEKTRSLGQLFEYLLFLLINNINSSVSCLELANFKLSIIMDILLFDHSFNSGLVHRNNKDKNYVKISNNNYLDLIRTNNRNSILLLSNLYYKLAQNNDLSVDNSQNKHEPHRESGTQQNGSENSSEWADKEGDCLDYLSSNKLISSVFLLCNNGVGSNSYGKSDKISGSEHDKTNFSGGNCNNSNRAKLLNEKSLLDVLMNVNLLTYFINNNVEMLRMMINYLENMVCHYNSEFTSTFCTNVISALVVTSILHYMAKKEDLNVSDKTDAIENDVNRQKKLRALRDSLKKIYLHKLLMLYSINNLNLKHLLVNQQLQDEKCLYLKLSADKDEYKNSLTRFILIQAYVLVLEFLYNYSFYEKSVIKSGIEVIGIGGPETTASSTITATEMLFRCVTDYKLVEYINRILNEDYGLPNYYLSRPSYSLDPGGSLPAESGNTSSENGESSSKDATSITYNFTFSHVSTSAMRYGRTQEVLNCKLGSVIDTLISSVLYNELQENTGLETREIIENNMIRMLGLTYNSGDRGKIILYELMYYVTMASLFNSLFNSSDQPEMGRKLKISMRIFNKLISHLSKLNNTSLQSVFNGSIKAVFSLGLFNRVENGADGTEQVGKSNETQDSDISERLNYSVQGKNMVDEAAVKPATEEGGGHSADTAESKGYVQEVGEESAYSAIIRLVFETVISDSYLWKHFKKYSIILCCFIKISPISNLLKFFSSFPELHLTYSSSYYNTLKIASNNSFFEILTDVSYFLTVLNRDLLRVIGVNSIGTTTGTVSGNVRGLGNAKLSKDTTRSSHSEPKSKRARHAESLNNKHSNADGVPLSGGDAQLNSLLNGEWFRFYFMYVQLLVRIYEMKHFGSEAVNLERNFYRNFTMPLVNFEHLSEFEYLSKDVILYLLNFKQITNDNNIVCYIGSSCDKCLFIYYMKGYNLSHAPTSSRNQQSTKHNGPNSTYNGTLNSGYNLLDGVDEFGDLEDESDEIVDEMAMFLYLLSKLTLVNNIRILQVIVFSIFPILVHSIPNKNMFDSVYNSLLNIRQGLNSFTFIKYMLLTVIFNWYHRYFFTYNFFIYQYNNNRIIDNELVEKYLDKYLTGDNIEFNFNFTFVKIPLQYIHHLQSLF